MSRIEAIALYELVGRRDAVVAPNASSGIRPAESRENLLLLLGDDGKIGVTNWVHARRNRVQADISWLIGLDPRSLFRWDGGLVSSRAPEYEEALADASAIDVALLDLCAQAEEVPLWRLLGNRVREAVPACDSTLYFEDLVAAGSTPQNVVDRAMAALNKGHRALKIKVGRGLKWMPWPSCTERDIEVCLAVREAVGPDVRLMVDANKGFTGYIEDAVDFLSETECCQLAFAEELVDERELSALKKAMASRGLSVPLAGGEDSYSREWCEQVWPKAKLDVLQMDICYTGLVEYLSIASFARDNGLLLAPHNFGSQIGVYASLQLGAVTPEYLYCECDDSQFDGYSAPGYVLRDGHYTLPSDPGFGVITDDPRTDH